MGETANMSDEELAEFQASLPQMTGTGIGQNVTFNPGTSGMSLQEFKAMAAAANQNAAGGSPTEAGNAGNQASDLDRIEEIQEQTKLVDENQHVPGDPPRSNYSTSDRTGLPTSDINAL